jgi:hypothetical protein
VFISTFQAMSKTPSRCVFLRFNTFHGVLCDNFMESDTHRVNNNFTIMKTASKEKSIRENLIKWYQCEVRLFKRILGIK